jgi:hypothetical protein
MDRRLFKGALLTAMSNDRVQRNWKDWRGIVLIYLKISFRKSLGGTEESHRRAVSIVGVRSTSKLSEPTCLVLLVLRSGSSTHHWSDSSTHHWSGSSTHHWSDNSTHHWSDSSTHHWSGSSTHHWSDSSTHHWSESSTHHWSDSSTQHWSLRDNQFHENVSTTDFFWVMIIEFTVSDIIV